MNAMTDLDATQSRDYARIADAILFILAQRPSAPSLDDLAAHVGLSPFHFQRLFKRWAGVSPKQFMGYLTVEHAKAVLERSTPVLNAAFDVGLSGPSRLHDLFVTLDAMTPGEYKAQGRDLVIRYGVLDTRFGPALIMATDRGVCGLEFVAPDEEADALAQARAHWPLSTFVHEPSAVRDIAAQIGIPGDTQLNVLVRGTNFQIRVWAALLRIPSGTIATYGDIARAIGQPTASRAVGTALAANTVGYLVPCHRVLQSTGLFRNYRWGAPRRHAMLAWEAARQARESGIESDILQP